jgi:hypothetical protein
MRHKPPNPKHALGKPLDPIQGYHGNDVGYTISHIITSRKEHCNIRLWGYVDGHYKERYMHPHDLDALLRQALTKEG